MAFIYDAVKDAVKVPAEKLATYHFDTEEIHKRKFSNLFAHKLYRLTIRPDILEKIMETNADLNFVLKGKIPKNLKDFTAKDSVAILNEIDFGPGIISYTYKPIPNDTTKNQEVVANVDLSTLQVLKQLKQRLGKDAAGVGVQMELTKAKGEQYPDAKITVLLHIHPLSLFNRTEVGCTKLDPIATKINALAGPDIDDGWSINGVKLEKLFAALKNMSDQNRGPGNGPGL